jgi:hypothetical protein
VDHAETQVFGCRADNPFEPRMLGARLKFLDLRNSNGEASNKETGQGGREIQGQGFLKLLMLCVV